MRNHTIPLLLFVLAAACDEAVSPAADPIVDPSVNAAAASITAADIADRVGALAHDSMKGRASVRPEIETAASYIGNTLEGLGLEPAGTVGFFQRFDVEYRLRDASSVGLEVDWGGGPVLEHGSDYVLLPSRETAEVAADVLWGGSAETTPDADQLDMTGRMVLYDLPASRLDAPALELTFAPDGATQQGGAAAVGFVVPAGFTEDDMARAESITWNWSRALPTVLMRESVAAALLSADGEELAALRAGGPQQTAARFRVRGTLVPDTARPPNVAAVLTGSHATRRDEYVVVSAHYDHIGAGLPEADGDSIYNGADDNASGTAAVLEVAKALASLDTPPERSVLFLLFSAEEMGLLGSRHFVASPTVPSEDIVAAVNLDMVGRNAAGSLYAIGMTYSSVGTAIDTLATLLPGLGLAVTASPPEGGSLFSRSDHFPFACRDVPGIWLFTGFHDEYHAAGDEPDLVDNDKVARVARLTTHLVHRLASVDARPAWNATGQSVVNALTSCP